MPNTEGEFKRTYMCAACDYNTSFKSKLVTHQRSCKTEAPSGGDDDSTEAVNDSKIEQNMEEEPTLEMVVEEVD